MSEIDWAGEGYEGTKLAYLVTGAGFFCEHHRATHTAWLQSSFWSAATLARRERGCSSS